MPIKTTIFDASEYLDDEASQAEYLTDALGTNDPAAIAYAIGIIAKARGMSKVARDAGVQRENLYRALSGEGNPVCCQSNGHLSPL